jgi:hypothetical protein
MTARWSLVSTMHGLPETILPCIAHHLQSDAEFLHIYLDAPNPPVEAALATQPRCLVTICDEAYWSTHPKGRLGGVVRRQMANLRHAKRHGTSDWLVHVDSDEFLVPAYPDAKLSLGVELARMPENHDWARISPMERVLLAEMPQVSIFDGMFRTATTNKAIIADAYGDAARFLSKGLSGHTRGKIAFRRKSQLKPRLHDVIFLPSPGERPPITLPDDQLPPFTALTGTRLLHFNGWTPLHLQAKLLRFIDAGKTGGHNRGRRAAVGYMVEHNDPLQWQAVMDSILRLPEKTQAVLLEQGLLRPQSFNPESITRQTFPGTDLTFSASDFDARLRAANPRLGAASLNRAS